MRSRVALSIFALLLANVAFASDVQASFEKLKSLQGNWAGKAMNQDIQVSFRVTSGGSALISEIHSEEDMVTVFHLDGDRLLMTHYCSAGNQPRMAATVSPDGKTFTFNFLDAANVLPSQPGHMQKLVLTILDADHHTESWVFLGNDGKTLQHEFELRRTK